MTTVRDHHGYQTYPPPGPAESRGSGWHLHRACDADQRARFAEVAELATGFTIEEGAS